MEDYLQPIEISSDDPICCATALEGTVIGILFEKSGLEIKQAIDKRIGAVEGKISEYEKLIEGSKDFIEQKEKDAKVLDKIYSERNDEKKSKLRPFQRNITEIQEQMRDMLHDFNKETEKEVGKQAVVFEKDFDKYEKKFAEIDEILRKEEEKKMLSKRVTRSIDSACSSSTNAFSAATSSRVDTDDFDGIDGGETFLMSLEETEEDKALSKLNTVRGLLSQWRWRIDRVNTQINDLKYEIRRLTLVKNHINEDRQYKLDINKLSAFGFESVEIA